MLDASSSRRKTGESTERRTRLLSHYLCAVEVSFFFYIKEAPTKNRTFPGHTESGGKENGNDFTGVVTGVGLFDAGKRC